MCISKFFLYWNPRVDGCIFFSISENFFMIQLFSNLKLVFVDVVGCQPNKRANRCPAKKSAKVVPSIPSENAQTQEDMVLKALKASEQIFRTTTMEEQEVTLPVRLNENVAIQSLFSTKPLRFEKKGITCWFNIFVITLNNF